MNLAHLCSSHSISYSLLLKFLLIALIQNLFSTCFSLYNIEIMLTIENVEEFANGIFLKTLFLNQYPNDPIVPTDKTAFPLSFHSAPIKIGVAFVDTAMNEKNQCIKLNWMGLTSSNLSKLLKLLCLLGVR